MIRKKCEEVLKEILDIEPYDEDMALMMIRLYVRSGKRSKAIIYYNTFRNRLAGGLGIEPSEKLRKAYEEIKAASAELSEKDVAGRMSRKEKSRQRTIKKGKESRMKSMSFLTASDRSNIFGWQMWFQNCQFAIYSPAAAISMKISCRLWPILSRRLQVKWRRILLVLYRMCGCTRFYQADYCSLSGVEINY